MALSSSALVTLADLKTFLGTTVRTDDAIMEASIDRASAMVERYCGRRFSSQRFVEEYETFGAGVVRLKQAPVISCRFVGVGSQSMMTVRSAVGSDAVSSVSVTDTGVDLYRMTSAGVATATSLTFATYPTVALMAAAIDGTAGFDASSLLDGPSQYLRRVVGRELRNSTAYLESPTDSVFDYILDVETGVLSGPTIRGTILVDYTAGFATVPYDVAQAVLQVASRLYRERLRDPGVGSESLGGYSYSRRADAEVQDEMRSMLGNWRRIR